MLYILISTRKILFSQSIEIQNVDGQETFIDPYVPSNFLLVTILGAKAYASFQIIVLWLKRLKAEQFVGCRNQMIPSSGWQRMMGLVQRTSSHQPMAELFTSLNHDLRTLRCREFTGR
uniref:Uncharacterized protein n=1 Tax=Pelusios castaneus TaxID=367368 RepID=A0A8C8R838_9SAUR